MTDDDIKRAQQVMRSYRSFGNMKAADTIDALLAERERLAHVVKKANSQAEEFERRWYLRGDELEKVTAERDALRADAERFAWWFSDIDKKEFIKEYLRGVREKWTLEQWRSAIDAARKEQE